MPHGGSVAMGSGMDEAAERRGAVDRAGANDSPAEEPASPANWVQTMRTTQSLHVSLSQMADQKSSILMGATLVIFTITIGQARGSGAPLPLLVLGAFAFVTAVLVMLATLPAVRFPHQPRVNLLFFGSFTQLDEDDYVERLLAATRTEDDLKRIIAHDIYQNGRVLARKKYRLLGYAYRSFLLGLTLSLAVYVGGFFMPALHDSPVQSSPAAR